MKPFALLSAILFSILIAPGVRSGALSSWYLDVPEQHMYYDGIYHLTLNEAVTGYEDGNFLPMQEVNRVEALKMILEASAVPLGWQTPATYPDLQSEAWYMDYVNTATELGIVKGNEDGTFKPENTVNRAEALKMLILANDMQSELPGVFNEKWYSAYLAYGSEHALIVPDETGNYKPDAPLNRGELADILYRFQEEPFSNEVEYGIASYYGYSFNGRNTASGKALDAYGNMAAHKTLPFGTVVRVTNLDTGMITEVEIVDRGPYTEGYIIDLTPAAFEEIEPLSTGILNVRVEVLK